MSSLLRSSRFVLMALFFACVPHVFAQAPVIGAMSAPRQVVTRGQSLTLSVAATGATSYQWKRNGRSITGATNASYTTAGASPLVDNGWYQVVATNSSGSTTSAVVFVNVAVSSAQFWGWGSNSYGQITIPAGLSSITAIAAGGRHTLALRADGTVVAWGDNSSGQSAIPSGLSDVVAISAGSTHSLALKSDGSVMAWGTGSAASPLTGQSVVAIAAGSAHNLAVKSDGSVTAWGVNGNGQTTVPAGLSGVSTVAAGGDRSLSLKADGTVVAWGRNIFGESSVPAGLTGVVAIAAGPYHSLALKSDGTVASWGNGANGERPSSSTSGIAAVAAGDSSTVLLKTDGTVDAIGYNGSGQSDVPPLLAGIVAIAVGDRHSLALRDAAGDATPTIVTHPANQTTTAGGSATFSVSISGSPLPQLQWFRNGESVIGATGTTLTLTNVQLAQAGRYTVRAANLLGSVTSNAALLSGSNPLPAITTQPQDTTVTAGQTASLSVVASGTGPLTFQWRRNGLAIAGATTSTYTVAGVSRTDTDYYDVRVADGLSLTISSRVRLAVAPTAYPEKIYLPPTARVLFTRDNGSVNRIWPLADGRFYVAGTFAAANNGATSGLARYNADGTRDSTFAISLSSVVTVYDLVVQPDGKIVIGGSFSQNNTQLRNLARLNSDGSIDSTFAAVNLDSDVLALARQSDGRLLVGGSFSFYQGPTSASVPRLTRLTADGTLDVEFNPGASSDNSVHSIAVQPDGKILIAGSFTTIGGQSRAGVARLNADGTVDNSFNVGTGASDVVRVIRPLADGRVLIGGGFSFYNGTTVGRIARLGASGALDGTFASGSGFNGDVMDLLVLSDGRIVVGGSFTSYAGVSRKGLARLSADGASESGFPVTAASDTIYALALLSDGRIALGGVVTAVAGTARSRAARLNLDGTLDPTFAPQLHGEGYVYASQLLPGGRVLAGGDFTHVTGVAVRNLARVKADGSLDSEFNAGTGPNAPVRALLRQPDGRIIVAGDFTQVNGSSRGRLARITAEGSLDATFPGGGTGADSIVYALDSVPGGRIAAVGAFGRVNGIPRKYVVQLDTDGNVDPSFAPGSGPDSSPSNLAVAPDGRIYLGGTFSRVGSHLTNRIARLNADGSVDTGFVSSNNLLEYPSALMVRPDGRLLVGGYSVSGSVFPGYVALLNGSGARDTSFNGTGSATFSNSVQAIRLQEDGRILVSGWFPGNYARLSAAGVRETGFASTGTTSGGIDFLVRDDGQMFVGFGTNGGVGFTSVGAACSINTQPLAQTASTGSTVIFSVAASGTPAPTFQWYFNGTSIVGATTNLLTLTNVTRGAAGSYSVAVTNGFGSVTSNAVLLSGSDPVPTITAHPVGATVTSGQPVTLSVTASGSGTLEYQWRRNGVPISGATAANLTIAPTSRADADYYDVVVYAGLTPTVSQRAYLSVAPTVFPTAVVDDPTANLLPERPGFGTVYSAAIAADGKFYASGEFVSLNGISLWRIARFNADGSLDTGFKPPRFNDSIRAILPLGDGRVFVGGDFTSLKGTARVYSGFARLNADGSLDETLPDSLGAFKTYWLSLQNDGKMLVGGFDSFGSPLYLIRLNSDGTRDTSFNPVLNGIVRCALEVSAGKLIVAGNFTSAGGTSRNRIARLNSDGTLDATFDPGTGADGTVNRVRQLSDGKLLIGGSLYNYAGNSTAGRLARLTADGALDLSFNATTALNNGGVEDILLLPDGKIHVCGSFLSGRIIRLESSGALDSGFSASANGDLYTIMRQSDGRLIVTGGYTTMNGASRRTIARLTADGTLDSSFNVTPRYLGSINSLVQLPAGKVLVGGDFSHLNGTPLPNFARLNSDGSIDISFNPGSGPDAPIAQMVRQGGDRIVLFGLFSSYNGVGRGGIVRIDLAGTIDPSFDPGTAAGYAYGAPVVLPGGKIVVPTGSSSWGGIPAYGLVLLHANGGRDTSFDIATGVGQGSNSVKVVAAQPDGKIVVGGSFTSFNGQARNRILRLNPDGSLDSGFDVGTGFGSTVYTIDVQPDGRILVGGGFSSYNGSSRPGLARLNSNGSLDTSYAPAAATSIYRLIPQEDGRLLLYGSFESLGLTNTRYLGRLNANGTIDSTFAIGGLESISSASPLLLNDNGRLLGASPFDGVVRYAPAAAPTIATQPVSQVANLGGTVTFSAAATGTPAPAYRWTLNGSPVTGATNPSLTIANVQLANAGTYAVTISNAFGIVVSNSVTLSGANPAPTISGQPQNATATAGQSATFSVSASGTGTLGYQWRRNGYPIPGATASSVTFTASRVDEGEYRVSVADGLSITLSAAAVLRVAPAQSFDLFAPDLAYAPVLESPLTASFNAQVVQPDGKIVVVGNFTRIAGVTRTHLARLHPDGLLDSTFVPPVLDSEVRAVVRQPDGKLVIGGNFTRVGGNVVSRVARLNADGSFDPSFNPGESAFSDYVSALALQADGKVVVGGKFVFTAGSVSMPYLVRLNSDGSRDPGFPAVFEPGSAQIVRQVVLQSDGKIVAVGDFTAPRNAVLRINPDGTVDPAFNPGDAPNGTIENVVVSRHTSNAGKIYLSGQFTTFNGVTRRNVARLNADGTLDTAFATPASFGGFSFAALAEMTDGKVLVAGLSSSLRRLNVDGSVDTTLPALPANIQTVQSFAPDNADGTLIGTFFYLDSSSLIFRSGFTTLTGANTFTPAIFPGALGAGRPIQAAQVAGEKLLVAGAFSHVNGIARNHLVRLNADGSLDSGFDAALPFESRVDAGRFALQGDGRLVILTNASLLRRNANGSADASFPVRPIYYGGHAIDPAGLTLASNSGFSLNPAGILPDRFGVVRLIDGVEDVSFSTITNSTVTQMVPAPGGQYFIAGLFSTVNSVSRNRLARINADGSLDAGFIPPTSSFVGLSTLVPQPDGKLLFTLPSSTSSSSLQRLNTDGSLDTAFNANAFFGKPSNAANMSATGAVFLLPDGRILRGGFSNSGTGAGVIEDGPSFLSRHTASGQRDASFRIGNVSFPPLTAISQILLQDDGKLVLVGSGFSPLGEARYGIMRLEAATSPSVITHPVSQTAAPGASVTFTVQAAGTAPLGYQWFKNGELLTHATSATLALSNVQLADAGGYVVQVTNGLGSVSSNLATLAGTNPAPTISGQPVGSTVITGENATLSVTATGVGPLTYQWRRNGVPIAGATSATLNLGVVTRAAADFYDVIVADGLTTAFSQSARLSVAPASYPKVMDADPGFNPVFEMAGGTVQNFLRLADGRMMVVGDFTRINGMPARCIARLTADGTVDPTFTAPAIDGAISVAAAQTDGKVVIGGSFTAIAGQPRSGLARLNGDGTLDAAFIPGPSYASTNSLGVQADGKILAGGFFTGFLHRLNPDGSRDASFHPAPSGNLTAFALQSDGKIIVSGTFTTIAGQPRNRLARLNPDGALDPAFNVGAGLNGTANAIRVQPDGRVLLGGGFTTYDGATANFIVRLASDGGPDPTWSPGAGAGSTINGLELKADGRILVAGFFSSYNGTARSFCTQLNADGSLDPAFAPPAFNNSANAVATLADGTILVGGFFTTVGGLPASGVTRLGAAGPAVSPGLGAGLLTTATVNRAVPVLGGKLLAVGAFTFVNGVPLQGLARLHADGTTDTSFNGGGAGANGAVSNILVLPDGRLVIAGSFSAYSGVGRNRIARLTADGLVDDSFAPGSGPSGSSGPGSTAFRLLALSGGRLLLVGTFTSYNGVARNSLVRIAPDGSLDSSFDAGTAGSLISLNAVAVQPDGKIIVGGSFTTFNSVARNRIARLLPDGALDSSFTPNCNEAVAALALQPDGKVLVAGSFSSVDGVARLRLARLYADGSLDAAFDAGAGPNGAPSFLVLQEDGRTLFGGNFNVNGSTAIRFLGRLHPDGALDPTLGIVPISTAPLSAIVLDDGALLLAGGYFRIGAAQRHGLIRTTSSPGPLIAAQPADATILAGSSLSLTVSVVGAGGLTYQWFKNDAPIAGATAATYAVNPSQTSDSGSYTVRVTHRGGALTSRAASVTIAAAPPLAGTGNLGSFAPVAKAGSHFALSAPALVAGSAPLSYQWSKDDAVIAGATGSSYLPLTWEPEHQGTYRVTVSNGLGSFTSAPLSQFVSDAPDWTWRFPVPQGNSLSTVIHANGRFVAGGQHGAALVSTNGESWTVRRLGISDAVSALAFGNGLYVAIGTNNSVLTSPDAVTWTRRNAGPGADGRSVTANYNALIYGGGRFVAVGTRGLVLTSLDGVAWSTAPGITTDNLSAVAFGGGRFIALGAAGRTYSSADGLAWSAAGTAAESVTFLVYGAGLFAAAANGYAYTSPDGVIWTRRGIPTVPTIRSFHHTDVGFLAPMLSGRFATSSDGLTWTEKVTTGLNTNFSSAALAYGAGRYVLVGGTPDTLTWSADGVAWTRAGLATTSGFNAAATDGTAIVAVGSSGAIHASTDGAASWSSRTSGTTNSLNDVTFATDRFVSVGVAGTVLTSPDGATWTVRSSGTTNALRGVNYHNGLFHAVGDGGVLLTSPDGVAWSAVSSGTTRTLYRSVSGAGLRAIAGSGGAVLTSANGISWSLQSFAEASAAATADIVFANGLFVWIGGNSIRTSPDGLTWTARVNPLGSGALGSVVYVGGQFVVLASTGSSYLKSADGATWTVAQHGSANVIAGLVQFGGAIIGVGSSATIISTLMPAIVAPPAAETIASGGSVTFRVVATGSGPVGYQWFRNGVLVPGASGSSLTLSDVTTANAGAYTVSVASAAGIATSTPASLTVLPTGAPVITAHPGGQTAVIGDPVIFSVAATGVAPLVYQWRKNGADIPGATLASHTIANAQPGDAGNYSVIVSNSLGVISSRAALVAVVPAGTGATQTMAENGYVAGRNFTISNTLSYVGAATALGWSVLLPDGWSFVSDGGAAGDIKPGTGSNQLLDWSWTTPPPSPVLFSYVVKVPDGAIGDQAVTALVSVQSNGLGAPLQFLARPDPLVVRPILLHGADTDRDFAISLFELTRVIELYNTRNGTVRTGAYKLDVTGEDGFAADPTRGAGSSSALDRYHSADTRGATTGSPRDGAIDLFELTRVIELYNTRSGTVRTGAYHVQAGSEDGFAAGP